MPGPTDILWQALATHQAKLASRTLTELFDTDPGRADRYQINACGLLLDYSKNLVTDETLNLFSQLHDANMLPHRVQQLMSGARINLSENRPALHTLLRSKPGKAPAGLAEQAAAVEQALGRVSDIAAAIRSGEWTGHSGRPIRQVIHIGIGGSYLGPAMVAEALTPYASREITCHYVANVDGEHIEHVLSRLDQAETLVIIASKTFTTLETMMNASSARQWLLGKVPEAGLSKHLIAVSANVEAAVHFGISEANVLPMWDWVGGRYSVWSAVGLPIAITHGFNTFRAFLDGAAAMDAHFDEAPWPDNMPMMLALLGIWYHNFHDAQSHAVLPYNHFLRLLPAHLQQLDMESNGKSVTNTGEAVRWKTGPIIWGGEGTNGQHAYHQLLHQGTRFVSIDFILPLSPHNKRRDHHDWLVANCFAQSQALMQGRVVETNGRMEEAARAMPGSRPSNMILLDKLTPESLGALVALYEHKVFCQAVIWQINPFDQWGVELGKQLGNSIHATISGASEPGNDGTVDNIDPSTAKLIRYYRSRIKR